MVAPLILLAFAQDAAAERHFRKLGVGRGLDGNVVNSVLVDRDGLLWVGSREGLFRYDGYLATAFLPNAEGAGSMSGVDVREIYEAHDGALWVATNTGGLNRRDPGTGEFMQFHHDSTDSRSLSDESVFGMAQDSDGHLWVGTHNGLNRLDENGRDFIRFFHEPNDSESLANNWVYTLHLGPSKQLWIGTVGGGVDRWNVASEGFEHFRLSQLAGGPAELDDVFAIHESMDGRVWIGTRVGLVALDSIRKSAVRVDLSGVTKGQQPLITDFYADRDNRLWFSTLAHGVLVIDLATGHATRAHASAIGHSENLPAPGLLTITGTDSTVFVGTWGSGVYSAPLEEPQFRLLTQPPEGGGLRHKNVKAVLGGPSIGKPWVGSFGGGPQQVDVLAGCVAPTGGNPADRIRTAGILSLAASSDGSYYAGSTEGLFRFAADGSKLGFDSYNDARLDGIGEGYVTALLPDASGLWVGLGGSGLSLRDWQRPHFRKFRHDPKLASSLSGDYITALAHGKAGRLWVGTLSSGLNLCEIERWSCERFPRNAAGERIGKHRITDLHRDRAGMLWVATDGGGLHRVTEGEDGRPISFEHWDASSGLLNDGIMAVESDDDGSLWLSTRHGLSRLDPTTRRVVNHVPESGLPVSNFNTGASSADAAWLYFGSVDGLLGIPRGSPMRLRAPSPVRVTAIESLTRGAATPLPPRSLAGGFQTQFGNGLTIEFAVLDFSDTTHEYAYRLQPSDPWSALGKQRQLTFFALAPGPYRFEVRGRDVFGQWSTSAPLAFEIVPPFWMTTWFRLLAVAAGALLILGLHVTRLRSLRRRNAVLEQLERQREQALERAGRSQRELEEAYAGLRQLTGRLELAKEEERSHISRELHDEFGQTLTAAKINLQMLRRSTSDSHVAQRLEDSVGMIDGMIRQARNIALGLRPPLLDEAGLVAALDHHLKSLAGRSGVRIELDAANAGTNIPSALNTTIFRLVQEAVSNALRHAQCTTIRVTLSDEGEELWLTIEDDGVGFDPEAVAQRAKRGEHLGLLGMTERARSAGGSIALHSRPGAGSRIEVRIPLDTMSDMKLEQQHQ